MATTPRKRTPAGASLWEKATDAIATGVAKTVGPLIADLRANDEELEGRLNGHDDRFGEFNARMDSYEAGPTDLGGLETQAAEATRKALAPFLKKK